MYSLYMGPNDPQHDRVPETDLKMFREIDHVHIVSRGDSPLLTMMYTGP